MIMIDDHERSLLFHRTSMYSSPSPIFAPGVLPPDLRDGDRAGKAASPLVEESVENFRKAARRFGGMFTLGEFWDMLHVNRVQSRSQGSLSHVQRQQV